MDWITDNIKLVVVALVSLGYWIAQRRANKRAEEEDRGSASERQTTAAPTTDADDQIRRIQEEIRRKIQERRQAGERSPQAEPPPLQTSMPRHSDTPRERLEPPPLPAARRQASYEEADAAESERQQKLAEQLRALELQRRDVRRAAQQVAEGRSEPTAKSRQSTLVLGDIRDPATLRRAIILQEILGKPVSMR